MKVLLEQLHVLHSMGLENTVPDQVAPCRVGAFVDDDHVMVEVDGKYMEVIVGGCVSWEQVFHVVEPVGKPLEERHGCSGCTWLNLSSIIRPVSSLDVLNDIYAAGFNLGKRKPKEAMMCSLR